MRKTGPEADALAAAVAQARANSEALAELAALYREVDEQLAALGQTCRACGACCDFALYDHRLYLTTVELALLTSLPPTHHDAVAADRCPYQDGSICAARQRRALGCRVFSCDAATDAAEQDVYDRYHNRLGEMHRKHSLTYLYVDLIASLGQLAGQS